MHWGVVAAVVVVTFCNFGKSNLCLKILNKKFGTLPTDGGATAECSPGQTMFFIGCRKCPQVGIAVDNEKAADAITSTNIL